MIKWIWEAKKTKNSKMIPNFTDWEMMAQCIDKNKGISSRNLERWN